MERIVPGDGYSMVCSFAEGIPVAKKFNERGYSAFIVFYRVRRKAKFNKPQEDLARAVREVLTNKEQYNLLNDEYGLIGFSAGGHLASSFATKNVGYPNFSVPKPSFLILGYPVTSMMKDISHESSHDQHVGKNASLEAEKEYTVYLNVDKDYPRTFIATGTDDRLVNLKNTSLMKKALEKASIDHKVVWFLGLPHGFGTGKNTLAENWIDQAIDFAEKIS